MAKNKIKQFRTRLKLSQRDLAERAGTSQQQIQRIEAGTISTSLDAARAISRALGKPFEVVFPEAAKALVVFKDDLERSGYLDPEAFEKVSQTGVEADLRIWYFKVHLQGVERFRIFRIDPATYRRLYLAVQSEGDLGGAGMNFIVFDTPTHRVALNLAEMVTCQFLFEGFEPEEVDEEEPEETVSIYPVGGGFPITFDVDPDEPEEDGIGQIGNVFFMVETAADVSDRYRIVDQDGEHAFIRAGSIAIFEAPLCLLEQSADDEDEDKGKDE